MELSKQLTVVLTTHILPTAPSTYIIEECIKSIREQFEGINECKFLIVCDVKNPNSSTTKEYINNLRKIKNIDLVESPNSSLQINYNKAIDLITTPFMLFVEHDWIFLNKINLTNLLKTISENIFINFIRFSKRDNFKAHIDNPEPGDGDFWETHIEIETKDLPSPLIKTNCFATHPHIIRVSKFINDWRILLKTFSIEWDIHEKYNEAINKYGFIEAHNTWGIYNYGKINDKKIITHLDGSNSGRI